METIITFSDSEGNYKLPYKEVIDDALKNGYTNSAFWNKIKAGKLPYIVCNKENNLIEANFMVAAHYLGDIYWLTDDDVPYVTAFIHKVIEMDKLKANALEILNKFK